MGSRHERTSCQYAFPLYTQVHQCGKLSPRLITFSDLPNSIGPLKALQGSLHSMNRLKFLALSPTWVGCKPMPLGPTLPIFPEMSSRHQCLISLTRLQASQSREGSGSWLRIPALERCMTYDHTDACWKLGGNPSSLVGWGLMNDIIRQQERLLIMGNAIFLNSPELILSLVTMRQVAHHLWLRELALLRHQHECSVHSMYPGNTVKGTSSSFYGCSSKSVTYLSNWQSHRRKALF